MLYNRTWLAFANRKRCRHADAIHAPGFISWRMGRPRFAVDDVVYLFMSDERCVRFKLVVTAENCKCEDQAFWVEKAPDEITYKLELLYAEAIDCKMKSIIAMQDFLRSELHKMK